jgi:hypothetical protein
MEEEPHPAEEVLAIWGVLAVALLGLAYALFLRRQILREGRGTPEMLEVWEAIREGADAYLNRRPGGHAHGPACRPTCAWLQAARESFNGGAAHRLPGIGTVTGMLTDGLGLFGGTIIFVIFGVAAPDALLGFGFGGTLLALFMRVGGGIYTKAADVGADLVGKVEQDMPKTTRATPPSSPTWWATTWATAPVWQPTSSRATRSPSSRPDPGPGPAPHHRQQRVDDLSAAGARHRRAGLHLWHLPGEDRARPLGRRYEGHLQGFLTSAAISTC